MTSSEVRSSAASVNSGMLDTAQLDTSHGSELIDAVGKLETYRLVLDRMERATLKPAGVVDFGDAVGAVVDDVGDHVAAAVTLGLLPARVEQTVVQRPLAAIRGAVVLDLLGVDGGWAGVTADQVVVLDRQDQGLVPITFVGAPSRPRRSAPPQPCLSSAPRAEPALPAPRKSQNRLDFWAKHSRNPCFTCTLLPRVAKPEGCILERERANRLARG